MIINPPDVHSVDASHTTVILLLWPDSHYIVEKLFHFSSFFCCYADSGWFCLHQGCLVVLVDSGLFTDAGNFQTLEADKPQKKNKTTTTINKKHGFVRISFVELKLITVFDSLLRHFCTLALLVVWSAAIGDHDSLQDQNFQITILTDSGAWGRGGGERVRLNFYWKRGWLKNEKNKVEMFVHIYQVKNKAFDHTPP